MIPTNRLHQSDWFCRIVSLVLFAALIIDSATTLRAADDLTVLPAEHNGVAPRKMLSTYLLGEAQKMFDARRATIAALRTPDDVARRQKELKQKFIDAIGGFPEKTPLNPQVVGKLAGDGYRIEKVIYESRPQHHVTALFYIPEGPTPVPGVLFPCGHSANGKAADAYQHACILLAKNGLAVLCYDPIGQGERIQLLDTVGKPAVAGSTSEHTMVGVGALLVGQSTAGYRIWDGIRSLDYLASRPEVDPKRLGCTGNSGGGTLTAYLMALDDRIAVAAPSCYITSLERLFATIGPQDAEQNITGQVAFGMEHSDYVTMRAPRPTLICVGTQDFFDITGAWTTYRESKLIYGLLGHGERVDLFEFNDKHGFSQPRREAAMRWMRRWLLDKNDSPVEVPGPIRTDLEAQCTRTGQVLADFNGISAFDLNAKRERELAAKRGELSPSQLVANVRRLTGIDQAAIRAAKPQAMGYVARESLVAVQKVMYETEPGITVPGLNFTSRVPIPKERALGAPVAPLVIYLHGDGKDAHAAAGGPIEKIIRDAEDPLTSVLALDLRGMGETAPAALPASTRPNYFGVDTKEAWLGIHLNRPLLGQRVADVIAVLNMLRSKPGVGDIHLIGVGSAGPIALHVAALDPRIAQVTLERSVVSWSAVARTPVTQNQLTNVVPFALEKYDLPDLAASLAPRPLTIRGVTDPAGKPVSQKNLDETYARCKAAYVAQKAEMQLSLVATQP